MSPSAKWIWPGGAMYLQNCYAGFRHDFSLERLPSAAPLSLTADQSYRLYVNGRYVCRGPVRGYQESWHYDTVDILPFLKPGHNWLAVEAHNPGISTFAYNHADQAGFICSADWDNGVAIRSGIKDWTMFRNTGRAHDTGRLSLQMGWQEELDLQIDDRSWIEAEQDFHLPPQPKWCRPQQWNQGSLPWTGLAPRPIPLLDEHEQAPVAILSAALGTCAAHRSATPFAEHNLAWDFALDELHTLVYGDLPQATVGDNRLTLEIPPAGPGRLRCVTLDLGADEWLPGTPIIEYADADAGQVIDLFYFHWLPDGKVAFMPPPGEGSLLALASRLHLRQGNGQCELFQLMGVRNVTLCVRENRRPLKLRLGWRTQVYPMTLTGSFHCSDSTLNDIHRISVHTQRVCSLDAFVDTPWREQSQWWGDARVQAKNTHFLTADSTLLRQGIRSIAGQHAPENLTFADAPTTDSGCVLPDFCLTWLVTLHDLWFQTGETEHLHEHQSRANDILAYFERTRGADGLLRYDPRFWLFEDWSELPKSGAPTFLNLWHLYAVRHYATALRAAGLDDDAQRLEQRAAEQARLVSQLLFDESQGLFLPQLDSAGRPCGVPSVHDQVLALELGLRPEARDTMLDLRIRPCLEGTLTQGAQPSSFWATYLLDVAQRHGLRREALDFIRREWARMIPTGTVWEVYGRGDYGGWSYSHAWSAHLVSHLPELVFGVRQTAPAWRQVELTPLAGLLKHAQMTIPTPQGTLRGNLTRHGDAADLQLEIPQGMSATLVLPAETVRTDGAETRLERRLQL